MTTETSQTPNTDPTQGTQTQEQIDWEKRYKDLQSYHDKTKQDMVNKEDFDALQQQLKGLESQTHIATQKEILGSQHPDFGAVVQSEQFGEWIQSQPVAMQEALYDQSKLDGSLAASALTLFKSQTGAQSAPSVPDTTQQAAMAVNGGHRETPQVDTKRNYTYTEIQNMSPDEYEKLRDDIRAAHLEGRIK